MRILLFLLVLFVTNEISAGTFNGSIDVGGHVSVGMSLLMGGTARKEDPTSFIAKSDYHRVIHPDVNYGFTFHIVSNPKKKVQGYFQADAFLQNHWLENRWGSYRSDGSVIYTKSAYYRMFEIGFSHSGGLVIRNVVIGVGLDHIFTLSDYSRTNFFYHDINYPYSYYDKKGGPETTWFYKIDMSFKIGYRLLLKKKILIEPFAIYAVGVFHQYDAPINFYGLGESGRIDNCRVGIIISKVIKVK